MEMIEIDKIVMGEVNGFPKDIDYARGVGRATAIIWAMLHSMSEERREYWEDRLRFTADNRKEAKKVEESTTYQ